MQKSEEEQRLVETARRVLPAATFGNVASEIVIARGKAGHIWDVSGNEYIDYLIGSGPMIVGHAHPKVTEAVMKQVPDGTTFFANNPHGIRLAEVIADAVPCVEQVRFVSTGSEADMYAMRIARAFTGREKILKFEGGYHGMSDYGLMSLAPKRLANFPQPVPDSAGIPTSVQSNVVVAPYNDLEALKGLVSRHKDELAAIIIEPFQRIIPPEPGFLEAVRKITAENDIVLIFDEVVTGFRLAYGGAQEYYGVTPDICTMGKAIGGGFPLAALGGRADIMAHFDRAAVGDDGFVMQIGTLSGNPVAAAAGLATLEILREPGAYDRLFATGQALMDSLAECLKRAGIPAVICGVPPLFDVVFTEGAVRDYRGTFHGNPALAKALNRALLERGILKSESKYYISLAHTDEDVKQTIAAFEDAIPQLMKAAA
jgi:glutamate-1-semialdehyde 2,1-aminomutase